MVPPLFEEETGYYRTVERQTLDLKSGQPDSRATIFSLLHIASLPVRKEASRQEEQGRESQTVGRERGGRKMPDWDKEQSKRRQS